MIYTIHATAQLTWTTEADDEDRALKNLETLRTRMLLSSPSLYMVSIHDDDITVEPLLERPNT